MKNIPLHKQLDGINALIEKAREEGGIEAIKKLLDSVEDETSEAFKVFQKAAEQMNAVIREQKEQS